MNPSQDEKLPEAWLFYDGDCPVCRRWVSRVRRPLSKHHFMFAAQQSELAQEKLNLKPGEIFSEMKVITVEGLTLGGIDAVDHIARFVWWLRPLRWLTRLPGGMWMARRVYTWFAAHRSCDNGKCSI